MQNHILIFIHIYILTHTHPQKGSFFKHFHEEKCKKLGTDSKKCQCRLKRPAIVEHMSMSMVPPNVDPIWSTSVYTLNSASFCEGSKPPGSDHTRAEDHVHTKDSGTDHVRVNLCSILYKLTGWLASRVQGASSDIERGPPLFVCLLE